MKRYLAFVMFGLLALIAWKPGDHWYTYNAGNNSYSIDYPGKPDEKSQTIHTAAGTVNYVQVSYTTNAGRRAFLSTSMLYNIDPKNYNVQKGLDGARDGAAQSTKATVTSEKKIDYKGVPGRELYMAMPHGTKAKLRAYIVNKGKGPVLYQVLVVDTDGKIDVPDTDLFFKSFKIKNP